jgi:hypothetical protein
VHATPGHPCDRPRARAPARPPQWDIAARATFSSSTVTVGCPR